MDDAKIAAFIRRWEKSGGAERANYQLFLTELCDVLGVNHPEPTVRRRGRERVRLREERRLRQRRRDAQHAAD